MGRAFEAGSASEGRLGGQLLVESITFSELWPSGVWWEVRRALARMHSLGSPACPGSPSPRYSDEGLEKNANVIAALLGFESEFALSSCLRNEVVVSEYRTVSK